ncbi:MAG: aldehyde dehydrogenase family protein [Pseudolabrys sp.]
MYENLLANVPTDLWIGGRWRKSSDDARFDVTDPATEKTIASVASATVDDAMAALDAAQGAFADWAGRKPRERGEILRKCYELIMRNAERFAKLVTLENGKALPDSRGEVAYAAEFFRWYAEEAVRNLGSVSMAPASGARIVAQHKPAGIAVLVTPWNFPAAMATGKIGPALAAGSPVVLKPASDTPLTMLALMPALEEAGVPPGVVNVIPSRSSGKVVSAMLHDPRVRVVSFTGSTEVGRKLLHEAADNIVKPAMELGGNAPFLVFEDADIKLRSPLYPGPNMTPFREVRTPERNYGPARIGGVAVTSLARRLAGERGIDLSHVKGSGLHGRIAAADVGVAAALDGGLITPVLRSADTKSVTAISAEMRDFAARARDNNLSPHEYQGGSSTISNLGMYGTRAFTAVINLPHATILAVGATRRAPVETEDGGVRFVSQITVTLACDHRVLDGALGAELLAAFTSLIETPVTALV